MSRILRVPPRGRSGAWLVALGIALLLAIQPIWPDRTAAGVAGAILLTMAAAARWQLRWLPVVVLVSCAVVLRLAMWNVEASDVADVTRAAIQRVIDGANPYGIGYWSSRPPGAGWPYGPVAIGWYLPALADPSVIEGLVSGIILVALGLRAAAGRPLGLAIYAVAPPLVLATVDGSNDTSAGLLILVALVVASWRPVVGATLLAVAVAFKPYAAAWVLPLAAWGGFPVIVAFVVTSLAAWSPILLHFGVGNYLRSLALAEEAHLRSAYWSVAAVLDGILPGGAPRFLETLRYAFAGATAFLGMRYVRMTRPTIDGVILVGTATFVVAQFGGYFGSYVYLGAIAPILCWRVDDWFRSLVRALARGELGVAAVPRLDRKVAVTAGSGRLVAVRGWLAARSSNDGHQREAARDRAAGEPARVRSRGSRAGGRPRDRSTGLGRLPGM